MRRTPPSERWERSCWGWASARRRRRRGICWRRRGTPACCVARSSPRTAHTTPLPSSPTGSLGAAAASTVRSGDPNQRERPPQTDEWFASTAHRQSRAQRTRCSRRSARPLSCCGDGRRARGLCAEPRVRGRRPRPPLRRRWPAARGAVLWRRLARPAAAQRARRAARGERARDDSGPVPVGRRHRRKLGPRTSLGWRQRTRGREECGQPRCQWVGVGSYRERSKSVVAVARGATAHQERRSRRRSCPRCPAAARGIVRQAPGSRATQAATTRRRTA
mmetsp:Transcript_24565/g.79329  ORF Transcript_24565/g.79329 Transcript_24565/m.79329 type:complete len:277 (+) Transcript_24565:294-1124(+)